MNPTLTSPRTSRSTRFALAAPLTIAACTPKQDPNDPDQCPDINYNLTAIKDAQYVATYPAIDAEVTSRMAGKFPGVGLAVIANGEIVYLEGAGRTAWSHGGLIDAFRSQITYWPNEKVGVVVFANRDTSGVGAIGDAVGSLWMSGKAKPAAPDRNQQAQMATATYALSRDHFPFLENFVRGQIKRHGERGAGDWLIRQLGAQSARSQALVNGILRNPNDLETACQGFFDVLRSEGSVAGYRRR